MANSLDRDIVENEVVVLAKKYFKPEFQSVESRLFKVVGGFGMDANTMGKALFGTFLCDGEKTRMEGYMVDPKETKKYQDEHGVFGDKS